MKAKNPCYICEEDVNFDEYIKNYVYFGVDGGIKFILFHRDCFIDYTGEELIDAFKKLQI